MITLILLSISCLREYEDEARRKVPKGGSTIDEGSPKGNIKISI